MKTSLFYLCLLNIWLVFSQEPVFYHLTEKDGLPDIEFYDIIEDKEGFIWLAADKGLFRYDGKTFKNYSHTLKKGLSVFNLQLDQQDRLWCNNISGQFFYVEKDTLQFFTDLNNENNGQLAPFFIKDQILFTYTFEKSFEINIKTKERKAIFETDAYRSLFKHNDSVFCATKNSIIFKENNKEYVVDSINNIHKVKYAVAELKADKLGKTNDILLQAVLPTEGKRRFFLRRNHKFETLNNKALNLNSTIISSLSQNNTVWLATYQGVYKYAYNSGEFVLKEHLFRDKIVTKIIQDKSGNYWFTTLRNGVYIIPNINLLYYQETAEQNISVLEKLNDSSFVYGTTKGALVKTDKNTNTTQYLPTLSNTKVNEMAYNNYDKLIVSQMDKAYMLDGDFKVKLFDFPNTLGAVKEISFLNKDEFVYGAFAFSSLVNLNNKTVKRIGQRRAYTTHYNSNTKTIYIGYVDGIEFYKEDFVPKEITFNGNPIFALDIDNTDDDMVWISTFSDGLIGVKSGKVVINYTTENGLLSNKTRVIKSDGSFLWIVTDKGIQLFNTQTKTFKNITKKDGLTSFNVSDIITFNDFAYLGTNKGIYRIHKETGFKSTSLSDFYITKVLVEDEEVVIKDNYDFPSEVNKVQFQFHTNGFLSEENTLYQYRLLGSSEDWNDVSEHINQVTFNSLSAGSYTFQIKKVSTTNDKETAIKSIALKIKKPFYKTLGFIAFVLLCGMFIIGLYFFQREKKIKNRQKELLEKERLERQMVSSKLKSLQSQMNPHFIFNAMNSIQNLILKNDKKGAYDYLTKFATLMRENLHMSEKSFVYFDKEVSHLKKYLELEKLRFRDNFSYQILGADAIGDIKIPSAIIQPFIENAIKHGLLHKTEGDKTIVIEFSEEHEVLKCSIADNGIGIEGSKAINTNNNLESSSFSTKSINEKLKLLKKYYNTDIGFYYEDVEIGTKVVLKIPAKVV